MNRRRILQTGAATILIGGSLSACSRHLSSTQVWRDLPQGYDDPRMTALASAILAPSPHNRQPWLIELDSNDGMTLYPDLSRLLPQTDPLNRQIVIGLGAFIEALSLAAADQSRSLGVVAFPDGAAEVGLDDRPIAKFVLGAVGSAQPDNLFAALRNRRTNRTPFADRPVPNETLAAIGNVLASSSTLWGATSNAPQTAALRGHCDAGWIIEMTTPRTHLESVSLTRIGGAEVDANPDGISLTGLGIDLYSSLGLLTRDKMKNPDARAFKMAKTFYADLIDSARSFGWLVTSDNSRQSQLGAGRDWLRIHLAATQAGIAFQPFSQVLQEFPEMAAQFSAVHELLSVEAPAQIQGLFRLGYAKNPKPSPRWPLQTRVIEVPA